MENDTEDVVIAREMKRLGLPCTFVVLRWPRRHDPWLKRVIRTRPSQLPPRASRKSGRSGAGKRPRSHRALKPSAFGSPSTFTSQGCWSAQETRTLTRTAVTAAARGASARTARAVQTRQTATMKAQRNRHPRKRVRSSKSTWRAFRSGTVVVARQPHRSHAFRHGAPLRAEL